MFMIVSFVYFASSNKFREQTRIKEHNETSDGRQKVTSVHSKSVSERLPFNRRFRAKRREKWKAVNNDREWMRETGKCIESTLIEQWTQHQSAAIQIIIMRKKITQRISMSLLFPCFRKRVSDRISLYKANPESLSFAGWWFIATLLLIIYSIVLAIDFFHSTIPLSNYFWNNLFVLEKSKLPERHCFCAFFSDQGA